MSRLKNNKNRKIYIYVLKSPTDHRVMYVGKTTNPKLRYDQHLTEARCYLPRCKKLQWLRSLLDADLRPEMEVIEECDDLTYAPIERRWILHYKSINPDLVNTRYDQIKSTSLDPLTLSATGTVGKPPQP